MESDKLFRMSEIEAALPPSRSSSLQNTIVLFRRVLDRSSAGLVAARVEALARAGTSARSLPSSGMNQETSPWR